MLVARLTQAAVAADPNIPADTPHIVLAAVAASSVAADIHCMMSWMWVE